MNCSTKQRHKEKFLSQDHGGHGLSVVGMQPGLIIMMGGSVAGASSVAGVSTMVGGSGINSTGTASVFPSTIPVTVEIQHSSPLGMLTSHHVSISFFPAMGTRMPSTGEVSTLNN